MRTKSKTIYKILGRLLYMDVKKMIALNQFSAEKEKIRILPSFKMEKLFLVSQVVGPFLPQSPCTVPLWMALFLKKQARCKIIIPDWLAVDSLQELARREKESEGYQKVHEHYLEIASLLLEYASDDFEDANKVRTLLEDVETIRREKVRRGLEKTLITKVSSINLSGLSMMELGEIKPFLLESRRTYSKLSSALQSEPTYMAEEQGASLAAIGTIRKGGRKLQKYS